MRPGSMVVPDDDGGLGPEPASRPTAASERGRENGLRRV